jgi:hypothetical protein
MHKTLQVSFLFSLLFLVQCNIKAQTERESLKGHQRIGVVIENLTSEIENKGITRDQLQADVEVALRKSGIRIDNDSPGYLYVNINIISAKTSQGVELGLAYDVQVQFKQLATLSINKVIAVVTTWESGTTGVVGHGDVGAIRNRINDFVTRFINDFLAANPSKP